MLTVPLCLGKRKQELQRREMFVKMLEDAPNNNIKNIFLESRALARDADVGEQLYKQSVKQGVEVECRDYPGIFAHNPTPVQVFLRRVCFAVQELEANLIRHRLRDGQEEARKKAAKRVADAPKKRGIANRNVDPKWDTEKLRHLILLGPQRPPDQVAGEEASGVHQGQGQGQIWLAHLAGEEASG